MRQQLCNQIGDSLEPRYEVDCLFSSADCLSLFNSIITVSSSHTSPPLRIKLGAGCPLLCHYWTHYLSADTVFDLYSSAVFICQIYDTRFCVHESGSHKLRVKKSLELDYPPIKWVAFARFMASPPRFRAKILQVELSVSDNVQRTWFSSFESIFPRQSDLDPHNNMTLAQ